MTQLQFFPSSDILSVLVGAGVFQLCRAAENLLVRVCYVDTAPDLLSVDCFSSKFKMTSSPAASNNSHRVSSGHDDFSVLDTPRGSQPTDASSEKLKPAAALQPNDGSNNPDPSSSASLLDTNISVKSQPDKFPPPPDHDQQSDTNQRKSSSKKKKKKKTKKSHHSRRRHSSSSSSSSSSLSASTDSSGSVSASVSNIENAFGLSFRSSKRTEAQCRSSKVILRKKHWGKKPKDLQKTRYLATKPLKTKFVDPSIDPKQLSTDFSALADETFDYQCAVYDFSRRLQEFDMDSIFWIPNTVEYDETDSVSLGNLHSSCYQFLLTEWRSLSQEVVVKFQRALTFCASPLDGIANQWAQELIMGSCDQSLLAMVHEDLFQLDDEHAIGGLTMFFFTVQRQVSVSQETIDFLRSFITKFDIRTVDGEDVSLAVRRIRSVCRYLRDDIPSNAVACLLDGFSHAENSDFKQLCATQNSLFNLSSYRDTVKNVPLTRQINSLCTDLERLYKTKLSARAWNGVGREGKSVFLSAPASTDTSTSLQSSSPSNGMGDRSRRPGGRGHPSPTNHGGRGGRGHPSRFFGNCHHCGRKGHKAADCRKKIRRDLTRMATDRAVKTGNIKDIKFLQHVLTLSLDDENMDNGSEEVDDTNDDPGSVVSANESPSSPGQASMPSAASADDSDSDGSYYAHTAALMRGLGN